MVDELRFNLNSADQVEASVAGVADTDMMRRAVRNARVTICAMLGVAAGFAWFGMSAPGLALGYVAMAAVGLLFSRRFVTSSYRRRVAKVASRDGLGSQGHYTVGITEEGLTYDGASGMGLIKWTEFKSISQSAHTYALKMNGMSILAIPKATESGDAPAFIEEVRRRSKI